MQSKNRKQPDNDAARNSKRRFRIIKLEERIAPAKGGKHSWIKGYNHPPGHHKDYCQPWIGWGGEPYPSC